MGWRQGEKMNNINLKRQEALAAELRPIIDKLENKYHKQDKFWNHAHRCTFEILCHGDINEAERQCARWRAEHPIHFPKNWPKPRDISDYCDFCEMMNYVALDEEGRIIYTQRIDPNELLAWHRRFDKQKKL